MSRENNRTHWDQAAVQRFHLIGSPMRPSEDDTKIMEDAVAKWYTEDSRGSLKVLLCGVTPEIACMAWPDGTELLAVDQSKEMIRLVWPGDIAGRRRAERGDWLRLPQANKWFDLVVGDGCFSCMEYTDGYRILAASVQRVLKKQGLFLMRFFVRPEVSETPQDVFRDLLAGRIGSFSAFRWRLTMALQEDPRDGVRMGDVWQAWVDAGIDWNTVVARTGWPAEVIHSMPKDGDRFSFPTLEEVRTALSDHFEEVAVHVAQYELAERCPTVVFRPV
jgi:SAM-dependent methyltransferase